MYIQDTITMDILNPKETITCRPGAPIYHGPPGFTPSYPPLSPALIKRGDRNELTTNEYTNPDVEYKKLLTFPKEVFFCHSVSLGESKQLV